MYLRKYFGSLSNVFSFNNGQSPEGQIGQRQNLDAEETNQRQTASSHLRFHSVHGKAITLTKGSTVANRDPRYFEHSVVFSQRPINTNETIAVEIMSVITDFHGPLRIGFTSCNPLNFEDDIVPLGRDLRNADGFWIKSVQLFPMKAGTVIYFKVDANGIVLYGVDGQNAGIFIKDVDVSQHLWVMLEAYGSVQSLRFVDKTMELVAPSDASETVPLSLPPNRSRRSGLGQTTRRVFLNPVNTPLNTRRNVRLPPLQNIVRSEGLLPPMSPMTPAFASPTSSPVPGLCIICTERERDTAFTKCGHLCMCYECADNFKNQQTTISASGRTRAARKRNICPICRQPITNILRIYQ